MLVPVPMSVKATEQCHVLRTYSRVSTAHVCGDRAVWHADLRAEAFEGHRPSMQFEPSTP